MQDETIKIYKTVDNLIYSIWWFGKSLIKFFISQVGGENSVGEEGRLVGALEAIEGGKPRTPIEKAPGAKTWTWPWSLQYITIITVNLNLM